MALYADIKQRAAASKATHIERLNQLAHESLARRGLPIGDRDGASWWRHARYWFDNTPEVVSRPTEHEAVQGLHDLLQPPRPEPVLIAPHALVKLDSRPARPARPPRWESASVPELKPRHRRKVASRL